MSADSNVHPQADAASVIGKLTPRAPERRKSARVHWLLPIRVVVERKTGDVRTRQMATFASDLSAGGIAFYYDWSIETGARVAVTFRRLNDQPTLNGRVKHVEPLIDTVYRIGLEFDPEADPHRA